MPKEAKMTKADKRSALRWWRSGLAVHGAQTDVPVEQERKLVRAGYLKHTPYGLVITLKGLELITP